MWWDICIWLCHKFPTESNSERILKIGQYLVKLWARVRCLVFLTHDVGAIFTVRVEYFSTLDNVIYSDSVALFTLLVGRQEGHLACKKTEWYGAGIVICLEWGADLHMAQLMPLPLTVSCFSKIQKGPLSGCVCVCELTHSTVVLELKKAEWPNCRLFYVKMF